MVTNLFDFLSEAADQRDDTALDQGVITVISRGMIQLHGYVVNVTPELLTLERIKRVHNEARGHITLHPYLHHIVMDKIVMARYSDLKEVNR